MGKKEGMNIGKKIMANPLVTNALAVLAGLAIGEGLVKHTEFQQKQESEKIEEEYKRDSTKNAPIEAKMAEEMFIAQFTNKINSAKTTIEELSDFKNLHIHYFVKIRQSDRPLFKSFVNKYFQLLEQDIKNTNSLEDLNNIFFEPGVSFGDSGDAETMQEIEIFENNKVIPKIAFIMNSKIDNAQNFKETRQILDEVINLVRVNPSGLKTVITKLEKKLVFLVEKHDDVLRLWKDVYINDLSARKILKNKAIHWNIDKQTIVESTNNN